MYAVLLAQQSQSLSPAELDSRVESCITWEDALVHCVVARQAVGREDRWHRADVVDVLKALSMKALAEWVKSPSSENQPQYLHKPCKVRAGDYIS
jgi:hypothetical protein